MHRRCQLSRSSRFMPDDQCTDNVWITYGCGRHCKMQTKTKGLESELGWLAKAISGLTRLCLRLCLCSMTGRVARIYHRTASHRIASHPSRLIGAEMASAASSSSAAAGGKCVLVTGAAGRTGNEKRRRRRRRRKMCALIAQRSGVREHS